MKRYDSIRRLATATMVMTGMVCAGPAPGSTIEGRMVARSPLPQPAGNPYPDALFTAEIAVEGVLEGAAAPPGLIAVFPGFTNRVFCPEASYQAGDRVRLQVVPFEEAPIPIQRMQQADTMTNFELGLYYATTSQVIDVFSAGLTPPVQSEVTSPEPAATVRTGDHESARARAAVIRTDRERVERLLEANHGDWDGWYDACAPYRSALAAALTEADGFLYRDGVSFSSMDWLNDRFDPEAPDARAMLKALRLLRDGLAARGIDLVVAFVPERDAVSAPRFLAEMPADGILQPYRLRILKSLLEADIEVLDLLPGLRAVPDPASLFFYESADVHPADGATEFAAEALAERLSRYRWEQPLLSLTTRPRGYASPITVVSLGSTRLRRDGRMVLGPDGSPFPFPALSPVLFIGDSFLESPNNYGMDNGDVARHWALRSGIVPSILVRKSGTPFMLRYLARTPKATFQNRRVVVFYAGWHNLTGAFRPLWDPVSFDGRQGQLQVRAQAFQQATPMQAWTTAEDRASWTTANPHPDDWRDARGMGLAQGEEPRRVALPPVAVRPGRSYLVRVVGTAGAYETWRLEVEGIPVGDLPMLKGQNKHVLPVVAWKETLRLAVVLPSGRGGGLLTSVEVRALR